MTEPAIAMTCTQCGAALDGPFCSRDGTLAGDRFVIGERYTVESLIGGGGNGFVFRGRHLVLGKPVAIKILRDRGADSIAAKRFLREARTASQFGHEHIVSILDFGHCDRNDVSYLVMEHFEGVTLSDVIRTSAPIPTSRALPILIQLADALAAAHAAEVFHRDVTPRNVLVGRSDYVKLCDFGLSRSLAGDDRVTSTGVVIGTPAYMAPEAIRGTANIDHRVDIYGFGCTAYEMLTGRVPHASSTAVALLANRVSEGTVEAIATPELGKLPEGLEELVMRCLAPAPGDRPDATELVDKLRAIAARSAAIGEAVRRIGNYDVVEVLGSGGSGSVYRAKHPVIGTEVAIKVLHPEIAAAAGMAERFIQEARASSELRDPHIPRYYDFGYLGDGQPYAVLELLVGETLATRLARGPLALADATQIMGQVAATMARVHAAGLVHRDLKPDNFFLADGPLQVKILDFGIAKALAPSTNIAQTSVGLTLGTPAYCAPEQALGLPVDHTADIYALGATAFEMLAGRPPFEGTVSRVLGTKTTTAAPPLATLAPEVPADIARMIDRMLAREPADRPQTMQAVLDEIATWPREPRVVPAKPTTPAATTDRIAPRLARQRWLVRGLLAAAVIASGVIGYALLRGDDTHAVEPAPAARVSPPPRAPPPVAAPVAVPAPAPAPASKAEIVTPPARPVKAKPAHKPNKPKDDGVIVDPYHP